MLEEVAELGSEKRARAVEQWVDSSDLGELYVPESARASVRAEWKFRGRLEPGTTTALTLNPDQMLVNEEGSLVVKEADDVFVVDLGGLGVGRPESVEAASAALEAAVLDAKPLQRAREALPEAKEIAAAWWSADGGWLLTSEARPGELDVQLKLWNAETKKVVGEAISPPILAARVDETGALAFGGSSGGIEVVRVPSQEHVEALGITMRLPLPGDEGKAWFVTPTGVFFSGETLLNSTTAHLNDVEIVFGDQASAYWGEELAEVEERWMLADVKDAYYRPTFWADFVAGRPIAGPGEAAVVSFSL